MKCHYTVLGVSLEADGDQIKKAYRKLALKWHPDKNIANAEEATERFRLVQAAYDVLSDPQEKAWYDKHRLEILHKSEFENFKDGASDVLEFFTPSAYRGFGNDGKGFYAVYRDVFRKIMEEDKRFCDDDSEEEAVMPDFGDADSDYDDIVHSFYAMWQSYCTKLSYVWIDKYDVHEAPDRRIARLIEKENKKERDKEKKKRNELIRDLVKFVRKRDPRVKAHREQLEELAEKNAAKTAEKRTEVLRARMEEAAIYEENHREKNLEHAGKVSELENMLKDEFGFSSSDEDDEIDSQQEEEEDEGQDELYCIACNKQFKTVMAVKNHEKSKKHKEKLRKLQAEMREDQDFEQEESVQTHPVISDNEDFEETSSKKLSKKQKKQRKLQAKLFNETPDPEDVCDVITNNGDVIPNKQGTENNSEDNGEAAPEDVCDVITNNGEAAPEEINTENKNPEVKLPQAPRPTAKNKKKTEKKQNSKPVAPDIVTSSQPANFCVTCQREYPSRNKLFQHLKTSGHAMLVDDKKAGGGRSRGKKNRGR